MFHGVVSLDSHTPYARPRSQQILSLDQHPLRTQQPSSERFCFKKSTEFITVARTPTFLNQKKKRKYHVAPPPPPPSFRKSLAPKLRPPLAPPRGRRPPPPPPPPPPPYIAIEASHCGHSCWFSPSICAIVGSVVGSSGVKKRRFFVERGARWRLGGTSPALPRPQKQINNVKRWRLRLKKNSAPKVLRE